MDTARDEAQEALLGDIIAQGRDVVCSLFLNDTDGQEGLGEEEGYVDDGFGPLMPVQEEDYVHDGSGDTMEVQDEGDRADCSGHRTESGQVYILVKHVLTS